MANAISGTVSPTFDALDNRCLHVEDIVDDKPVAFDVVDCPGLLDEHNPTLEKHLREVLRDSNSRVHAVLSPSAYLHCGNRLRSYLEVHAFKSSHTAMPKQAVSEFNKSFESLDVLAQQLEEKGCSKGDTLLLVGGGVVMDLGGFHASTWRRGGLINYVAIPTTLTAAEDAALSPKTAINRGDRKNYYGTYFAPAKVLIDNSLFGTLNRQAILDGVAEMAKVAVVGDSALMETLERDGSELIKDCFQSRGSMEVVWRAARLFLELKWDERYRGSQTSIRSFGHFFSREMEGASGYLLSHGQAISIEMRIATYLSASIGKLEPAASDRILRCFDDLQLARWTDAFDENEIWTRVFRPLVEGRKPFGVPVPVGIGEGGFLDSFNRDDLIRAVRDARAHANGHVINTRRPS